MGRRITADDPREQAVNSLRNLVEHLQDVSRPLPSRDELAETVVRIYRLILAVPTEEAAGRVVETLQALARLGGASTPIDLGRALDYRREGHHAGAHGSSRLTLLRQAGLVRRVHFGWWELTPAGREMCARSGIAVADPAARAE